MHQLIKSFSLLCIMKPPDHIENHALLRDVTSKSNKHSNVLDVDGRSSQQQTPLYAVPKRRRRCQNGFWYVSFIQHLFKSLFFYRI